MSGQDELDKALADLNLTSTLPSSLVHTAMSHTAASSGSGGAAAETKTPTKQAPAKVAVVEGLVGIPRHFDRLRVTMTRVLDYRASSADIKESKTCAELWAINEGLMKIHTSSPTLFANALKSIFEKHAEAISAQKVPADFVIDMGDGLELKIGHAFKVAMENAAIREAELKQREIELKVDKCPERKEAGELLYPETIMLHVYRIGLEVCSADQKAKINESLIPIYHKLKMPLPAEATRIAAAGTASTTTRAAGGAPDFNASELAKIVTGIVSTAMNPEVKSVMDELRRSSGEARTPAEGMAMVQRLVSNPRIFQATINGLASTGIIPAGAMEAKQQ